MLSTLGNWAAIPGFIPGVPGHFELLIVLAIILLLFGNKLPKLMRSMGASVVEFKKGVKGGIEEENDDSPSEKSPADESATSTNA